jgi:2-methylcitrate dehydratase PrpD
MDDLAELAHFVATLRFEYLPTAVVERATLVLRDTVGAIIGGMAEPEVRALADHAAKNGTGAATLFGHGAQTSAAWVVLVHGTAGTTLEIDEGHAFARGHAAIHAVPAAFSLAELGGASGADVITALVAGYEVAARAGIATRLRPSVHPFGTWGVLGAAAAAAWLRGDDAAGVTGTLELAASYAIASSFATAYQGASARNTYAGVVNQLGLLAAEFHELGFRGEDGGLATVFGDILGERFEPRALSEDLGKRYEIMRGYFKPYSACRYTHAAVDATLQLRELARAPLGAVTHIEVHTYDIAAKLTNPAPATPLAARFSLPYVVAATLVLGSAGPDAFRPEVLRDPTVLSLAQRVAVYEEPAFTALTPARRPARVVLTYADGSQERTTVFGSKGDPDQPLTVTEMETKFAQLVSPVLGSKGAGLAWAALGQLAELPRLDGLVRELVAKDGPARILPASRRCRPGREGRPLCPDE